MISSPGPQVLFPSFTGSPSFFFLNSLRILQELARITHKAIALCKMNIELISINAALRLVRSVFHIHRICRAHADWPDPHFLTAGRELVPRRGQRGQGLTPPSTLAPSLGESFAPFLLHPCPPAATLHRRRRATQPRSTV